MKHLFLLMIAWVMFGLTACSENNSNGENNMTENSINIKAGNTTLTATLVSNSATEKLIGLLKQGSVTIHMDDYSGFEKVGRLPQALPTSNENITTVTGDIMLYNGNNIVVFYGSNTWNYTRLGKIDHATRQQLLDAFGQGSTDITLSLPSQTGK